jgi:Uma2 family endonuclease
VKKIIARLIEAYSDANDLDVEGFGSTTFSREELLRGLEPGECYYVAHAADVAVKNKLDLAVDPPPDLAVEVDISPPDLAKRPIYAALGVPEVWRYDGRRVIPMHRQADGYAEAEKSLSFPRFPMDRLNEFLSIGLATSQSAAVRAMRNWLQSERKIC